MKKVLWILLFLLLLSGFIWVYLKLDESSFRKQLHNFETCLNIESGKCLAEVRNCNSKNTNPFDYNFTLEKMCEDEYSFCLVNISCDMGR